MLTVWEKKYFNGMYLHELTDIRTLCMEGIKYLICKDSSIQIFESLQVLYDGFVKMCGYMSVL